MRFHFVLDGLSAQHQDDLLTIEKHMTPRSSTAVFEIKSLGLKSDRDPQAAMEFLKSKLSAFHLVPLEALLEVTKFDLQTLTRLIKNVPIVLKARLQ